SFSNAGSFALDFAANAVANAGSASAQASMDTGFDFYAFADSPGNASIAIDNARTPSLALAANAVGSNANANATIDNALLEASAVIDVGVGPVLGMASVVFDNSGSIGVSLVASANATGATTAQDADALASMADGFILEAFNNNNGDAIVSFTN